MWSDNYGIRKNIKNKNRSIAMNGNKNAKGNKGGSGAPKNNINALKNKGGKGAPKGNKYAKGNKGGYGPPVGNKNALKTGEFETIFFNTLTEDELELISQTPFEKMRLLKQEIQLLTVREHRMLKRIEALKNEKMILDTETHQSGDSEIDSRNYVNALDKIQEIEGALTRVQEKKLKAIDSLHKFKMDKLKFDLDKEKIEVSSKDKDSSSNSEITKMIEGLVDEL